MGGIIQPWLEYVFNLSFIHKNTFSYRLFDNLHTFSCRLFNKPYTFYGRLLGAKLAKKSIYTKLFWNFHKKNLATFDFVESLNTPKVLWPPRRGIFGQNFQVVFTRLHRWRGNPRKRLQRLQKFFLFFSCIIAIGTSFGCRVNNTNMP